MSPIELQISDATGTSDVVVSLGAETSLADVFTALSLPSETMVDGQAILSPETTAAGEVLHVGASLSVVRAQGSATVSAQGFVDVGVVAGLDAGASARLGSGLFHISPTGTDLEDGWLLQVDHRDPSTQHPDPQLPDPQHPNPQHPDPRRSDAGLPQPWQQHGAHVETLERCGDAILAVGPPVDPEHAPSSTIHRPPRGPSGSPLAAIEPDDLPDAVREPSPLSWATLLAPIPVALLMAFFFRPLFALFAAMGPMMALGRWWESRRRYRRATAERTAALVAIRRDISDQRVVQAEAEAQRRWHDDPHVAALWQRAAGRSVRLWERRPDAVGFMRVMVGVGPDHCPAVLADPKPADELRNLVHAPLPLRAVPHVVELTANSGIGVCGLRSHALAIARSFVLQFATLQGPADLQLGLVCSTAAVPDWDWLKWLPHVDRAVVGHDVTELVEGLSRTGLDDDVDEAARLIVVDARHVDVARLIRAAAQVDGEIRVLAVAADPTELPAVCTTTIVSDGGYATVTVDGRHVGEPMTPTGISLATAQTWARQLARVRDPEANVGAAQHRGAASLLNLVGQTAVNELVGRWSDRGAAASPIVTLGTGADGPFRLDLNSDGPHALVAGTTGSGKSELLRSLVVGLAVQCSPEHLNFILVDFKGGGAFDVVRDLPHVVGVITDLDEALVVRALVSLRAELERRERLFRDLGVSVYDDAVAQSEVPLARLVIVIDEFAVLATDYSELMTAIIDLATRGRSLGMHLVLATQRPSGVVDQKIRANTNVRIALRVQDAFDSQDVVGVPDAARIDRKAPGRAIVRIGGDRAAEVQMAFTGAPDRRAQQCEVRPHALFDQGAAPTPGTESVAAPSEARNGVMRTELQVIVDAILDAAASSDVSTRALWAPPLPATLDWIDLGARELSASTTAPGFALGLADLPERQSQEPWRWDPSTGPLGVYAASGPCAGKVLVSLGAAMASATRPDQLHLYVVDGDAGTAAALENVPHTGAYVRKSETDRVERVLRLFEQALDVRRTTYTASDPQLVLMIDNVATVLAAHDEVQTSTLTDRLAAIGRDGAPVGVHLMVSARTPRDISHRLAQQIPNRLVLSLADPSGYLALGIKLREVVPLPAMRAIDVRTRRVVQLVEPPDMASWSTDGTKSARSAPEVRSFPESLGLDQLGPAAIGDDGTLHIPIGIDANDLGHAALVLRPGEHALVVSAPGMGRSTAAAAIARQLDPLGGVHLVRIAPHRSPLTAAGTPGQLVHEATCVEALATTDQYTVIVVDDADSLNTELAAALEKLIDLRNDRVHIVAATTPDAARIPRSWTSKIRAGGTGVLIGGALSDGELFKVRLAPLGGRGTLPGRGNIIVRGRTLGVQLALPNTGG